MTTSINIATLIIGLLFLSCNPANNKADNVRQMQDTLSLREKFPVFNSPRDSVKNYNGENNRLFVFVGHKISVDPLPHIQGSMDACFKAKYLVDEKVFGHFSHDTIEFAAFDHYGIPAFSEYEDALLFVSADSGTYYHQKYLYNDVYKTKSGRWAGPYSNEDYEHEYNKKTKVKPVKIDFAKPVYYPLTLISKTGNTIWRTFPKTFFKTKGDSAIAIYGNYVYELFKLKRDGVLTARKIFKDGKLQD